MRSSIQYGLLKAYDLFKRSGWLETRFSRFAFRRLYFFYKRRLEDPFHALTRKHPDLFRGGHILDIGANIGYTAVQFARALTPGFKVYAFEPDRANILDLGESIVRHGMEDRIIPVEAAVGAAPGTVRLWHNERHHGDHRICTETFEKTGINATRISAVLMWSVDGFVAERLKGAAVAFIKVDVQGYEPAVLSGMEKTLRDNPEATVAMEYDPRAISELGFDPGSFLIWFAERGYSRGLLERSGEIRDAPPGLIEEMAKSRGYVDLVFRTSRAPRRPAPALPRRG